MKACAAPALGEKYFGLKMVLLALVMMLGALWCLQPVEAASARELDARVLDTMALFHEKVLGSHDILGKAKGVLVMPKVFKAGLGIGGEYGEGALQIRGQTVDYYNIVSASYGFQLGAQKKSILLFFMEDAALRQFRESSGWKVGVDASVALIKIGTEGSISTEKLNKPIIGFVIGQKGLMYDLSLEGSKFTKLNKKR